MQQLETNASQARQGLMAGDGVDIHTAMIATQNNKAVAAYQQVTGMQF